LELNPHKLFNTAEVGNILYPSQLSKEAKMKRVRRLVNANQLPMKRIKRTYYISQLELVRWLDVKGHRG
tara:strand:+ start:2359 stop:2565 length:207 start_codon:yes stop_codon:yes gene_type:complete